MDVPAERVDGRGMGSRIKPCVSYVIFQGELKFCKEAAVFDSCIHFVAWVDRKETPDVREGYRRVGESALEWNLTFVLAPEDKKA